MTRSCTVMDCASPVLAKGLCQLHYHRMRNGGSFESTFTTVKALDKFGRFTAIRQIPSHRNKWLCKCDCGNEKIVFASNLTRSHSTSCGCASRARVVTHGESTSREYRAWINMKTRCESPGTPYFKFYGGRGISVCDRWSSFENFKLDMGSRPSDRHSIDRIDVNGNYEPGNCRWATDKTQARNTRKQRLVTVDGRQMSLAEAVEGAGLIYSTVLHRLMRGMNIEDALRPVKGVSNG